MRHLEISDISEIEIEDIITLGNEILAIEDIEEIQLEDVITVENDPLEADWENVGCDD